MGKLILARESDKENGGASFAFMLVPCLIGGFLGLPAGGLLSIPVMLILQDGSSIVQYGTIAFTVVAGMLIAFLYTRKSMDGKNYTKCAKCKTKMHPLTPEDTIFYVPAEKGETHHNPFQYFARNMVRVSAIREIPPNKKGAYVCCYECDNCAHRIVRIAEFYPSYGTCHWEETYYFDYSEFVYARAKDDLL